MLRIIAINFLKIGNGSAIVQKHAATLVYVGTHFFPQFLETSRSRTIVMHVVPSFPRKNTHLLNGKGIDDSTENLSVITNYQQNYEKSEIVISA